MPSDQPTAPSNLALGRPATQSSISEWSHFPTPDGDAAGAVNGKIDGGHGFHTNMEDMPWWQVDLGVVCIVNEVRVYNRQHCAFRLIDFSILFSVDGEQWIEVYRRRDPEIFGEHDLLPVVAVWKNGMVCRFVRVRLNRRDHLHFCECEVIGFTATPDQAPVLEEDFHRRLDWTQSLLREKLAVFVDGREGTISELHGRSMFVDKRYHPRMIRALTRGGYENREITAIKALLKPTDRLLDLGSAVGAVSMAAAGIVGGANVIAVDANAEIMDDARKNFIYNGLIDIQTYVGIARNRRSVNSSDDKLQFYISDNFSASRIATGPNPTDIVREVEVPVLRLEDLIEAHNITAITCDIEGDEIELFEGADLGRIRLLVMEVHDFKGKASIRSMTQSILQSGFCVDFMNTGDNIAVFVR